MKMYKISLYYGEQNQGSSIEKDRAMLLETISGLESDSNESFRIQAINMTEDELAKLPEFTGY